MVGPDWCTTKIMTEKPWTRTLDRGRGVRRPCEHCTLSRACPRTRSCRLRGRAAGRNARNTRHWSVNSVNKRCCKRRRLPYPSQRRPVCVVRKAVLRWSLVLQSRSTRLEIRKAPFGNRATVLVGSCHESWASRDGVVREIGHFWDDRSQQIRPTFVIAPRPSHSRARRAHDRKLERSVFSE